MTFLDLPTDWADRRITDADIFTDVLDLLVSHAARQRGGAHVIFTDPEGHVMVRTSYVLEPEPGHTRLSMLLGFLDALGGAFPPGEINLVIALARPGLAEVTEADWHFRAAVLRRAEQRGIAVMGLAVAVPEKMLTYDEVAGSDRLGVGLDGEGGDLRDSA